MLAIRTHRAAAALLAGLLVIGSAPAQPPAVPPYDRDAPLGPPPPVPGVVGTPETGEVQARGPLHEAFAQPSESMTKPGPIVAKAPPEPIQELPPNDKPEGDNVVWIPGYWGWDDDRRDFLWISGAWRVVPGGRKWVTGYWSQAQGGWRWVSGLWARASANDLPYAEPPPASLDRGPSLPAPDDNSFYIPGTWMFRDARYAWRPGYWSGVRPGFVYVPSRYVWTPAGTVYLGGYWDLPLEDRGVLFAPVYFTPQLYARTGWWYRPRYTVAVRPLLSSLWVYPSAGYYAFGDYYGPSYARLGYYPWVSYGRSYRDSLYGFYRWRYRANPAWEQGLLSTYRGRIAGTVALPPRNLVAQQRLFASSRTVPSSLRVVQPLGQFRSSSLRLARVTSAQRVSTASLSAGYRRASVERGRYEARTTRSAPAGASYLGRVPRAPSAPRSVARAPGTAGPRTTTSVSRTYRRATTSRPAVSSRGPARSTALRTAPSGRPASASRTAPSRRGASPYRSTRPARRAAPSKHK